MHYQGSLDTHPETVALNRSEAQKVQESTQK
jgi:hypothetical protein